MLKLNSYYLTTIVIRKIIALILIVAVFNPFCCCFNLSLLTTSLTAETIETVEKTSFRSCCSSSSCDTHSPTTPAPSDDSPCCPEGCECPEAYATGIVGELKHKDLEKYPSPALPAEAFTFRLPSFRKACLVPDVIWEPPAWERIRVHILFCSSLT